MRGCGSRTGSAPRAHRVVGAIIAAALLALQVPVAGAAFGDTSTSSPSSDSSTAPVSTSTTSLLVKLVSGLSAADQAAVIARDGGTETSSVGALRLHVVEVDSAIAPDVQALYASDPNVQRVEIEATREAEGVPSDPEYANQWALPRIGWDQAHDTVMPSATATIAVL